MLKTISMMVITDISIYHYACTHMYFFKHFIYFLIGEKLLYNFVLVSTVPQSFDLHFSNNERC